MTGDGALALLRIARSIESEIARIESLKPRAAYPHDLLLGALAFQPPLVTQVTDFCATIPDSSHSMQSYRNAAKLLAQFFTSVSAIRAAAEHSEHSTGIDWWIDQHTRALGLEAENVLVSEGRPDDFHTLISLESEQLKNLASLGVLKGVETNVELLAHFHIMRTPPGDGLSPLWHPISLGHELCHIWLRPEAVVAWLAGLDARDGGDIAKEAVHRAQQASSRTTRVPWFDQLVRWLAEVGCDTAATFQYGPAGLYSLEQFWGMHAHRGHTPSHPSPDLRLAVQNATTSADLEAWIPELPNENDESRALASFCALAVGICDHVRAHLRDRGYAYESDVESLDSAAKLFETRRLPSSECWSSENVIAKPTQVEATIINALWVARRSRQQAGEALESLEQQVSLAEDTLDAIEFSARFARRASALALSDPRVHELSNVLLISQDGVKPGRNAVAGLPAVDLRLGRRFVAFQRNEITHLDGVLGNAEGTRVREEVEIGWGDVFVLHPRELVLAITFESVELDVKTSAQVLSRSSLGRLGLLSATAVQVQPGFVGCLTLELVNLSSVPLVLRPGQRIAQIVPFAALGQASPYDGRYQHAGSKPQTPLTRRDWETDILTSLGDA